jgi:hypothetical protein
MTRRHARWMVGLVGLALATSVAPELALAADDEPPVAVADQVTLLPGGSSYVDVMANDSDDLDQQALCRARGNSDVEAGVDQGQVFVNVPTDQPGDYEVQYQACDYDYLSVGTVTVHAVAPQEVTVQKVADQPGVLRATNPNPVRVGLLWGKPRSERASGQFTIKAGATKDFTVDSHRIVWVAFDPSSYWEDGSIVGYGQIGNIDLPAARSAVARPTISPRWAALLRGRTAQAAHRSVARSAYSGSWPTDPTTVEPPTPKTDTLHWWSGSWDRVPVTRNDTDPQGQHVDVCRLSPEADAPSLRSVLTPSVIDGQLDVGTARRATGTLLLPYYVCNSGRLAPALLRLVLVQAKPLQVTRLADDPHQVRVHNPNPARVTYVIGRPHVDLLWDRIGPHATKIVRVSLSARHWEGFIGRHGGYAGSGPLRRSSS